MATKFLERLEKIELPNEFKEVVQSIKCILSSDADLEKEYIVDSMKIGFTRIGDSASLLITHEWDEEWDRPVLVAGF